MKPIRWLWPILLLASLSGCVGSLVPKGPERAVYTLPEPEPMRAKQPLAVPLMVEAPQARPPLTGRDIIVVRADGEVQVLPGVRWAAPAPELLQGLIARQIEVAGAAPSVAQSAQAFALPLRLAIELHAFELREQSGALSARAAVSLRLVCTRNARVIASSSPLVAEAHPVPNQPTAATAALRGVASMLARQVVTWLDQVDTESCASD